jgi:AcrR family transcriptional regulator
VLTPKAQRTRERIRESALALFAEKGYEATTMRDVAARAGASLGLAYRYYASKEEFALELYLRLAEESQEWARENLPEGTIAERFERAMLAKLDQVGSHRGPLAALLVKALDPNSPTSALGEGTAGVREKMGSVFLDLGGIYGLAVGLVHALLVAAVTRALYFPLSEPAKHRRAVVMASVLGVLIVPGYWFVSLLRSSGYEGFGGVSGSVTGSFWGDTFIYTGFPPLLLALVAQWLGGHLAGWYEREAPRACTGGPAEPVLARALRNSRTVRRALFGILAVVMLLMLASGVGVYRNRTILVDVPGGSVDLSPNGGRVAVLSPSRFEVVGVDERRTIHAISLPRAGTTDVDSNVWSTNGRLLAVYDGRRVKVYDVAKGEEAAELPADNVGRLAWSEDGSVLAAGIQDPYDHLNEDTDPVLIWDGHGDEWSDSLPVEARNGLSEGAMALSPDGRTFATCDNDSIQLWDVESERLLRDIRAPGDGLSADYSVTLLSFDGELIAAGGSGGEVSVWRVRDGHLLWTEVGHDRYVTALAFSPDGDLLVSGGIDGKVKLWRSRDGELLQAHGRPAGYSGEVLSVAFHPKKERVISVDRADGYVRIWPRRTPSFFERLVPK